MKDRNAKTVRQQASLLVLQKAFMAKLAQTIANKLERQEKRNRRMRQYAAKGQGPRECARRQQQLAYDRGATNRRALVKA